MDNIKFKADGVTLLNLYKDNEYGIPPSFYSAARGVSVHQAQPPVGADGVASER